MYLCFNEDTGVNYNNLEVTDVIKRAMFSNQKHTASTKNFETTKTNVLQMSSLGIKPCHCSLQVFVLPYISSVIDVSSNSLLKSVKGV